MKKFDTKLGKALLLSMYDQADKIDPIVTRYCLFDDYSEFLRFEQ